MTDTSPPLSRASTTPRLTREEFAERFGAHGRSLWVLAAGVLGRPDEAEDVLQEAAIVALSKLDQFQPGTSFLAWMSQMVRYTALNHARKRKRKESTVQSGGEQTLEAVAAGGAGAGLSREDVEAGLVPGGELETCFDDVVLAGLRKLSETARACLLLRTQLDLEYREIASMLEIPEGTAMSHVHRARTSLRRLLGETLPADGAAPQAGGSA